MREPDFDQLVSDYYQPLYRFALSLAGREAEACDLTQQTFFLWATKAGVMDPAHWSLPKVAWSTRSVAA